MQLTIEVLPAPLGPMIENSSPSFTPKLTSVSARTPPKRSDTPRTSKACSTHSLPQATSACENSFANRRCSRTTPADVPSGNSRAPSRAYNGRTLQHIGLLGAACPAPFGLLELRKRQTKENFLASNRR